MRKRTNQEWLEELRGDCSEKRTKEAHHDLGKYVYEVTYNYLSYGQDSANPYYLGTLTELPLKNMAENFAQETLIKVVANDCALLNEFELLNQSEKDASFPYWAASIMVFEELRDKSDDQRRKLAHQNLTAYLYKGAVNFLIYKQAPVNRYLASLDREELEQLAQDVTQNTYEKLIRNDLALLKQFKSKGRFTSWLTPILQNVARNEVRDWYGKRRAFAPLGKQTQDEYEEWVQFEWGKTQKQMSPEKATLRKQVGEAFLECLEELPKNRKAAIQWTLSGERSTEEVAEAMGKSKQAVYSLVSKAKPQIRKCLQKKGYDVDILDILF